MATPIKNSPRQSPPVRSLNGVHQEADPFASETPPGRPHAHRYSSFDTQLFALNHPSSSPAQAKRALEAHLTETDRRIQETSKLGTKLVQQRVNLSEQLRNVITQEEETQIAPELRQKLVEIEREYYEVGRQSARAFLGPKGGVEGEGTDAPFALDARVRTCNTLYCLFTNPSLIMIAFSKSYQIFESGYRFSIKGQRAAQAAQPSIKDR